MMNTQPWLFILASLLLIIVSIAPTVEAVSSPPSFVKLSNVPSSGPAPIPLRAPSHLQKRDLDHGSLQQTFQSQADLRLSSLFPRQSSSDGTTTSSSSPNDKLQALGYLSGAYHIPLNISSSPAQLVFVQLDTGSSDLWVTSTSCTTSECKKDGVLKFDPSKSAGLERIEVDASIRLNVTASSFGGNSTNLSASDFTPLDRASGFGKRQSSGQGNGKADVLFMITYTDDTNASGSLASDTISLSTLSVPHQTFALINSTSLTLSAQGISGVLGLGFPRGSVISRSLVGFENQIGEDTKTSPFMTSVLQTSEVSYPMFGLYLSRTGGRATIGAVDAQILPTRNDREQVEWYDVYPFPSGATNLAANDTLNIDGAALGPFVQWVLPLHSAGISGTPATLTRTYSQTKLPLALIDSGSSSIIGPASDVESIFSHITNARHVGGGRFVVPCDTTDRMYFSFGGRNITLLPSDYIIGPDAQEPFLCFAWPAASSNTDATGVGWILGTPFLRAVYSLFSIGINDKESPKIGFYPLRQPAQATASSIVFAPQPTQSLSKFLASQATTINSLIPNQLVSLTRASTNVYFFQNATTTPSVGVVATRVGATWSHSAILPTAVIGSGVVDLPVVANSSSAMGLPSNPAATGGGDGGSGGAASNGAISAELRRGGRVEAVIGVLIAVVIGDSFVL
ncbi:related to MKC7 - aspartyl protease of the periplasmic space [Melanopsichium pennsylvanicum]|uniref:Related to MKC7 - aspartyl protease of the periplasmic space n=2 Tax=Melanopsichium pennsylvanicum TaxID=63383 RepID=A0AAJ4XLX1_9BASI|nr:related to MKC7-aspartyl protease of the periplasmic space [Melanopsichium pennsylvanicum 4]SNX84697.1 related to MKC7 - aspartyl protease of the periplasmic space [Melanopsichium pennsylvanicum]